MVVAIHAQPFRYHDTIQVWLFWPIVSLAVPYFLIVSAYFFWRKEDPSLKKYLKRIGILYLVWLVIDSPMIYKEMVENGVPAYIDVFLFFRGLFFGQTYSGSWYLCCSIWAITISFYIWKKRINYKLLLLGGAILYAIGKFLLYFRSILPSSLETIADLFYKYYGIMQISTFTYFIFIFMGYAMVMESKYFKYFKPKYWLMLGIMITILELYFNHFYEFPISVIAPLVIIPFLLVLTTTSSFSISDKLAVRLRKMSTLVFFIHPTFVRLIPPLGKTFVITHPIINYVLVAVISVAIAYIISSERASKNAPLLKRLY